ncbi:MAG: phage holin family protein [Nocardia sp.]|uniref:phage holin family protein n=1 Tax=Nocardia sp. TaxID=1821 RepID=UPI00261553EC|nr:phage holin family protein [Nocardia sp.]MCU1647021.1 phage holin family protein [Nocardia sp.]
MATDQAGYSTAIEPQPSPIEQIVRILLAELSAWLGPRLYRAGKFLAAEVARGVIALAALSFALIAAIYGTIYFFRFLTELFAQWMPNWAALLTTSALMLIPAGIAALFGIWQIYRMRTVRATASAATVAGSAAWAFARRNRHGASQF